MASVLLHPCKGCKCVWDRGGCLLEIPEQSGPSLTNSPISSHLSGVFNLPITVSDSGETGCGRPRPRLMGSHVALDLPFVSNLLFGLSSFDQCMSQDHIAVGLANFNQ